MKRILYLSIFAIGIINALSGCVSTSARLRTQREKIAEKETFRKTLPVSTKEPDAPVFPIIKRAQLSNGMTLLVVEDAKLPIATFQLIFKNGSATDPRSKSGSMALTARMLREGTKTLSGSDLAKEFANLGSKVSTGSGKDSSFIASSVLSNKTQSALMLMADMAQHPRFDAKDFERVKKEHTVSLDSKKGSPFYLAQVNFLEKAYGAAHPYANPNLGNKESVEKISRSDIQNTYNKYFAPNNAALIAVGDVTLEKMKEHAEFLFKGWKKKKVQLKKIPNVAHHKKMQTTLVSRPNTPQTFIAVGQPVISQKDEDIAAFEVLKNILSGNPSSRLDYLLREQKGWTYGVSTHLQPLKGLGPMLISTSIRAPYGSDALVEILNELEKLKSELVSDAEFKMAKNNISHSFANRYTTVGKIAAILSNNFIYDHDMNRDQWLYTQIKRVTKEAVRKAAQKAFNKNKMTAIAVGDLEAIKFSDDSDVGVVSIKK